MSPEAGGGRSPYRGEDRRRIAVPVHSPFGRPYALAVSFVVILTLLLGLVQLGPAWFDRAEQLIPLLQTASFLLAIAVGAMVISRWYLTSDAPALWIGVALLVYGFVRLAGAELLPFVVEETSPWVAWLRPASQVLLVVLLVRAATIVPVSSSISGPKLMLWSLAMLALLSVLMWAVTPIAGIVDGASEVAPRTYTTANRLGLMPIAFSALAGVFTWQGYRRQRWLFTWLGVLLLALAAGDLVRVFAPPPVAAGLLGKETLRLAGLLLALNGATHELLHTYRDSSTRLARSEYTAMTAQERIRQGEALAEERAHEARSALAAIEGATRTLEHYRDRLPPETQAALATAVSGEIRRLQRLVSPEQSVGATGAFSLVEALAPVVASERARGVEIDVDVAGGLVAFGRTGSTEHVVQTLFDNARRYAPGKPVTVRAVREGEWIVLRVEDRGPGVPAQEREAIFRRGVRGDSALDVPGSGLGLYVAAQLMREQSGELWVEPRVGGGASFAVALPRPPEAPGRDEPINAVEQSLEIDRSGHVAQAPGHGR